MTPSQENNSGTCPKCNSPIASGMKFCESCGAKVEPLPVCGQCGAPLLPNVKFCESCGKPVAREAAPKVSAAPLAPTPAVVLTTPAVKTTTAAPAPAEVKKPEPQPEPSAAAIEKNPDKKTPEKQKETAQKTPVKGPASNTQTLVIAGVVGLIIVAALAYFVLLPMLSGPGTTSGGKPGSVSGVSPTQTTAVSGTPAKSSATSSAATTQSSASASFVPEPTQIPPPNLLVTYQAERDPITGLVTITFTGGPGKNGISDISIRLTRSDGQVLTESFTPQQVGNFATLQGTKMTDRIEVIANYYNGEKYRIIDQLFEYKKRF